MPYTYLVLVRVTGAWGELMTVAGFRIVLMSAALSLASAAAASAQDTQPIAGPSGEAADVKSTLPGLRGLVGVLTPHASIAVSVTEQYDNNIAQSSAAAALLRGLVRDDYTTTPHVVVDLASVLAGVNVFVQGSAGYDYHENNKQLDRQRTDVKAGANMRFGRCSAAIIGSFDVQQSDLGNLFGSVVRNQAATKSVEADAGCERQSGLSPKIAVSQNWVTNSSAVQRISDTNVTTVTPSLAYSRPALGAVSIYGRYDNITYPNRVDLNRKTAGFDGLAGGATLAREITPKLSTKLDVSYLQLTPRQTSTTRFSGVNYDASFTYTPTTRSSLVLDFGRTVKPSVRVDANFDVTDFMKLSGKLKVGYRTNLELGVSQQKERFANNNLALGTFLASDTLSEIYAAVNFKVNRHVLLSLDAREQKRDANVAAFAYTDWRVGLTAAVTY